VAADAGLFKGHPSELMPDSDARTWQLYKNTRRPHHSIVPRFPNPAILRAQLYLRPRPIGCPPSSGDARLIWPSPACPSRPLPGHRLILSSRLRSRTNTLNTRTHNAQLCTLSHFTLRHTRDARCQGRPPHSLSLYTMSVCTTRSAPVRLSLGLKCTAHTAFVTTTRTPTWYAK